MLPFFRKIRYRLAENNQFLAYSRYAIGEILLVVVGILIALSVNNYNQSRMEKEDEAAYLEGIRSDLLSQISDYEEFISSNDQRITIINELLDNEVEQRGFKRNDSIIGMFNKIISVSPPTEVKTTFTELLSSGDLKLIRNESLKNDIVRFYQDLERMVQGSISNITNVYQNHLLSILTSRTLVGNQGNYSSYDGDLEKEVHDRDYPDHVIEAVYEKLEDPNLELELVNALNLRAIIEVLQKDRSRVIVESAQELIKHIETELRDEHDMEI